MSEKEKITDSNQQPFWQRIMAARRESGLSVAAFCQQEGISEGAYYYWRKKLSDDDSKPNKKSSPPFLEVVLPSPPARALEFVLTSGHTLRIPVGTDPHRLQEVLLVFQQVGLC